MRTGKMEYILALLWAIIVLLSLAWNFRLIVNSNNSNVLYQSKALFDEIVLARLWNARHDGVYVPITEETKPNSYLDTTGRDVETTSGMKLTKINPAYMTRQIAEIAQERDNVKFHITSLKPLRPENEADEWEKASLRKFDEGSKEVMELIMLDSKNVYRYMAPLITEKTCLKCHEKQGYSEGDIRGGISVTISADSYLDNQNTQKIYIACVHFFILILGISGIISYRIIVSRQFKMISIKNAELETEIAERKKTEIQLRKLQMAVEYSPATVVITDTHGFIEYVNPTFTKTTGYSFDEAIGQNPRILKSGQQDKAFYENLWQTISSGKIWQGDFHNKMKNGDVYWELASIAPILNEKGEISAYAAIKDDITQRKNVESELLIAKEKAETANRTKSQFLANMSHEIRTPLNAILGFSSILKEKLDQSSGLQSYCNGIYNSGRNLLNLINDILDLSKIEAGKSTIQHKPVNLNVLFEEIKQIFQIKTNEKGLIFEINIQPDIPTSLLVDETKLRQILFNFVGNSVKFTYIGHIGIDVKSKLNEFGSHIDLQIEVSDTGIGIAKNQQELIFEPFEQQTGQDNKYGGTGLGLAISKRLVEMMNGYITLESEPGKGTIFTICLRDVAIASMRPENESMNQRPQIVSFNNQVVLMAEDIESNRMVVAGYLESLNIRLLIAQNGAGAIELAKSNKPDLILMDMQMPIMNGYEATKILKSDNATKKIPIVALTASVLKEDEEKISNLCDAYLRKPVSSEELISCLAVYLEHTKRDNSAPNEVKPQNLLEKVQAYVGVKKNVSEYLIKKLEVDLFDEFEIVNRSMSVNKIKEFANNIILIGKESQFDLLTQWGTDLLEQTISFNFEKIIVTLPQFLEIRNIIIKS